MHLRTRFLSIFLISVAALALLTHAPAQDKTTVSATKINQLLQETGYSFNRKTDVVWYSALDGKTLKNFKLIVTVKDDLMVAFVTVAPKARLKKTPEFVEKLLKFNSTLDFVKVGLDRDGDIFVRADASVRALDSQALKGLLDQVAACANDVYEGVDVFLISD